MLFKCIGTTFFILVCNSILYHIGGPAFILDNPYWLQEILSAGYKILIYAGPVIILIIFQERKSLKTFFGSLCKRFKEYRVYLLWIGWFGSMWFKKSDMNFGYTIYPYIYILVVNSIVEESVFRGYMQKILMRAYHSNTAIIIQGICFGLIHIPLYYSHYNQGVHTDIYSQLGMERVVQLGPLIILPSILSAIALGIFRGRLTHKTKSRRPAIVCHSIHNGVLLFL